MDSKSPQLKFLILVSITWQNRLLRFFMVPVEIYNTWIDKSIRSIKIHFLKADRRKSEDEIDKMLSEQMKKKFCNSPTSG